MITEKIYKFSTRHCGMCMQIGKMLDKKGVVYQEVDCEDGTEETQKLMEAYNIHSVPVVIVIDVNGYLKRLNNIAEVNEWLSHQG